MSEGISESDYQRVARTGTRISERAPIFKSAKRKSPKEISFCKVNHLVCPSVENSSDHVQSESRKFF